MYRKFFKRGCDITISSVGIVVLFPIWLIVPFLIYLEDHGTPFYNGERLGKGGKVFKMVKFRTMKVDSEDFRNTDGTTFNSKDDPRVTRIGRFLRETSIDELPQLFNIIKGEMSLIGPRPDLPDAASLYNQNQIKKLSVLPGITGLAQAKYRNSSTLTERFDADAFYAENVSLRLDAKIITMTIRTVLKRDNVFRN